MRIETIICLPVLLILFSCDAQSETDSNLSSDQDSTTREVRTTSIIDTSGATVVTRFNPPEGYVRVSADSGSFGEYLRNRPLKPHGEEVSYYNGDIKPNRGVYMAVLDQDIGKKDLHQCADAVMLLKAEYHWSKKDYDPIHFHFTNGKRADYAKYAAGYRVSFTNGTKWNKTASESNDYKTFRKYMELIWSYCGTLSLSRELQPVGNLKDLRQGDVFIWGGSPGHAVLVMDVAENEQGEKVFMLAQSYMPAQQTQILTNPSSVRFSPWYRISDIDEHLVTPEWTFSSDALMRFTW